MKYLKAFLQQNKWRFIILLFTQKRLLPMAMSLE